MDGQEVLFTGAPEAVIFSAHYVLGEGWAVRCQLRRQYEDWADARTEQWTHLTTDELGDVLDVAVGQMFTQLGL